MVGQHLNTKLIQKNKNNNIWDNFDYWTEHKADTNTYKFLPLKSWDRFDHLVTRNKKTDKFLSLS